jgi:hypothetical protein
VCGVRDPTQPWINDKGWSSAWGMGVGLILPVILHGCETWSLTLREEHRLRVFENRVLRKIFGPKRREVT